MRRRSAGEWLSLVARGMITAGGFFAAYVCMGGFLILIISDPILRYVVGSPFYWSNEVSTFLMVLMVATGLGATFAKGKHVRLTLIFNRLPVKAQNVLWVILSLLTLVFVGILAYGVMKLAFSSLTLGVLTATAELPYFPWQMVAGFGLMIFFVAVAVFTVRRMAIGLALEEEREEEKGFY